MLLVPLSVNMAYSDAADSPTQILLGAKMADGTALYDLWYDEALCVLLFDTQAYADKNLAGYAPTAIYIIKMGEVCRSHINKERAAFGIGPM